MSNILKISDACSLALHSAVFLANNPGKLFSTGDISKKIHVSEAHLSKVLQLLAKNGIVKSIRGPKGGFSLAKIPENISLLDIYEIIEGPFTKTKCLLEKQVCKNNRCIFGNLLSLSEKQFKDYMKKSKLKDFC